MHELSTIARPYSKAIFEIAQNQGNAQNVNKNIHKWLVFLQRVASVVLQPAVAKVIKNKQRSQEDILNFLLDLSEADSSIKLQAYNLLKVLAENKRLLLLGEILRQYIQYQADAVKNGFAEVITAKKLPENLLDNLKEILSKKFSWEQIRLEEQIDPSLIGGFIIRIDDKVIDYSVKCQLENLKASLLRN